MDAFSGSSILENSLSPNTSIIDTIEGKDKEFMILYWEYVDNGTQWVTVTSKDGLHSWPQELRDVER